MSRMSSKSIASAFYLSVTVASTQLHAAELEVSASEYADRWPMTVAAVKVVCDAEYHVYILSDGQRYALNGVAADAGYEDVLKLRKVDAAKKARADRFS